MASTNSTSDDDEVIYDLTSEARARSTPIERPCSRSIGIQTTLNHPKKSYTRSHTNRSHHGNVSRQNSTDSVHNMHQIEPRMLTIETIWTGTNDVLADYMDPQDVRRTPPPKLPDRNKSMSEKPPRVPPKSANIASEQERQKNKDSQNKSKTTENNANNFLQPCLNVNQRRVVKYNLLLSMTINVLVMALGGTGFFSIVSGSHQEEDSYKYVLIAASFSVCYALLSLTTDALAMLALQRRNRELLLPWLIWYILDMAIYVSVMVLVITFMDNYIILLVVFKIIWTLFVWVNMRDLYTTGKIYGHVRRKLKSDILY